MFIRAEKNKNYSVISNECLRDRRLSARAKGIWAYIMSLPNDWQIRQDEIFSHFTEGKAALRSAWKELAEAGYVKKTPAQGGDGRFAGWDYTVVESPMLRETAFLAQNTEVPETDTSVNGLSVNRAFGNRTLLSTDGPSTEKKLITYKVKEQKPKIPYTLQDKNIVKTEEHYGETYYYDADGKMYDNLGYATCLM
jgi:hypothetical protein